MTTRTTTTTNLTSISFSHPTPHSLLVAAVEVDARDLPLVAADEIPVGAGVAGLAVVAVPPYADDGAFLKRLGDLVGPWLDNLFFWRAGWGEWEQIEGREGSNDLNGY